MMKAPYFAVFALIFALSACSETVSRNQALAVETPIPSETVVAKAEPPAEQAAPDQPRILAMGDSMMAWHSLTGGSIAHTVSAVLDEPVSNHAISGARVIYKLPVSGAMGMKISNQYRKGDWDWVVLNGGGNDLWMGCGCGACEKRMNKMISEDGRKGAIPHMVDSLRKTGAKVIYVGYLRSPGAWSPIEGCRDDGDALEARIAKLADILPEMYFVSLADLVPSGDRSYHGADMIHPSRKGSAEIGMRVAEVISSVERGN